MMLFTCCAGAQEDSIATASSTLQEGLSNLKQSVEKLKVNNDQLAARDNAVKDQAFQLQAQLERLIAQGDLLNKAAVKLQGKNPRRAQQIIRLEKENLDLDGRIQKSFSPETRAADHSRKEKLKLMKMIYDSQQRQVSLHQAILDLQSNAPPILPAASALAHQQFLKEQVQDLEVEIAAYPPEAFFVNAGSVSRLEAQLKALEQRKARLEQMTQNLL